MAVAVRSNMDTKVFLGVLLAFLVASQVFQIFFLGRHHRRDAGGQSRSAEQPSRPTAPAAAAAADSTRRARGVAGGSVPFEPSKQAASNNNGTLQIFNSSDMVLTLQAVARQIRTLRHYVQGNATSGNAGSAGSLPTTESGTQRPPLGQLTTQALLKRVELFEFFVEATRDDILEALRSSLAHDAVANYNNDVATVFTESKQELRRLMEAVTATSDLLARLRRSADNETQHIHVIDGDFIAAAGHQSFAELVTAVVFARDDTLQGVEPQALLEAIVSVKECLHPRARVLVAAPASSLAALNSPLLQFVEFVGEISLGELIGLVHTPLLLLLQGGVRLTSHSRIGLEAAIRRLWRHHDVHHSQTGNGSASKVPALIGFFGTELSLDSSTKAQNAATAVCGNVVISDWKLEVQFIDRRAQQLNFALHHRDHRVAQAAWDELHLCDVVSSSFLGVTKILQTSMKAAVPTNVPTASRAERSPPFLNLQSRWTQPWTEILALQLCVKNSGWSALVGFAIEVVDVIADSPPELLSQQWAWEYVLASALNPDTETHRVLGSESMRQRQLLLLGDVSSGENVAMQTCNSPVG